MSQTIPTLSSGDLIKKFSLAAPKHHSAYRAMYSSWYGGIVTDSRFMMLPIDDHMVHRGDGVFEAFKCLRGKFYALRPHLQRLENSAAQIGIPLPMPIGEIEEVARQTLKAAQIDDALIRLYVSRGPGGFSTNPYESVGSQLYLVVTVLKVIDEGRYAHGVSLAVSSVPCKEDIFPTIKSCNYLPNVLMKKEAVDKGVDFTVGVDPNGFITEGSTENIAFIFDDEFLVPRFKKTLRGITITRVMELAKSLPLTRIAEDDITLERALKASEIMMIGTTLDVLPVTQFNGRPVGSGKPGRWSPQLRQLLLQDMRTGNY